MEHVVPKSFMKHSPRFKDLVKDGHNIILYPRSLNSHRSNFTIVEAVDPEHPKTVALDLYGNPISCPQRQKEEEWHGRLSWKNTSDRQFVPAWPFRGEIARACQYMDTMYPELHDVGAVYPRTIDPMLAHMWIKNYPMTAWERQKQAIIHQLQSLDPKSQ
jgi:endonuclease I